MPSSEPSTADPAAPATTDAAQSQQDMNSAAGKQTQTATPVIAPKLSAGAELKKKAKEEKAARRAQALQSKPPGGAVQPPSSIPGQAQASDAQNAQRQAVQRRGGPAVIDSRSLPQRGISKSVAVPDLPKEEDKTVEFFRHLYKTRTTSIAGASKEVHPAVLALGLQMASYTICGSCARLVATLQAFKRVIESYTTPPKNSLARHLTSHVLSPQIDFLSSCRPLSISMGNAIRWLKLEISKIDVSVPDTEAKKGLCDAIDVFIRERVTYADQVIAQNAADTIKNGDVILTFAKSSVVQKALVIAHEDGKQFRVIVVDSRPLHEGKNLATALVGMGLDVKYCLINGLSHTIHEATKVFLGAHAMMGNGRLFSRIGSALVAMEASSADKPVIVLCETIKFTDRTALDSIVHNEIAPADEMVLPGGHLDGWKETKRLQLCNLMFDVTPEKYIQMIVTELGAVPPTSVPVLHRLGNENQG